MILYYFSNCTDRIKFRAICLFLINLLFFLMYEVFNSFQKVDNSDIDSTQISSLLHLIFYTWISNSTVKTKVLYPPFRNLTLLRGPSFQELFFLSGTECPPCPRNSLKSGRKPRSSAWIWPLTPNQQRSKSGTPSGPSKGNPTGFCKIVWPKLVLCDHNWVTKTGIVWP